MTGRTTRVQEFFRGSFRERKRARYPHSHTGTRAMSDPTCGSPAEPLPHPSRSLAINCVAVEVIGAGAGRSRHTSGICKHVVEFTPAVKRKNVVYLPCSVEQSHISPLSFPVVPPLSFPVVPPQLSRFFSTVSHLLYEYDTLVPSHPVGVTVDSHTAT